MMGYRAEARAVASAGANMVKRRGENIFNGLLRVPVNGEIPVLNSILMGRD